jgi:hypothetical protein
VSLNVIEGLHSTNERVRQLMSRLQNVQEKGMMVSTQDFDDLKGELIDAAVWLRSVAPGSMPQGELAKEVTDYRSSLERLQEILPAIYACLLTEKTRIESTCTHLGAAEAWAGASKSTV